MTKIAIVHSEINNSIYRKFIRPYRITLACLAILALILLIVSACADHTETHPNTETRIVSFEIDSPFATEEKLIVNSAAGNTAFTFTWDVISSDPYYVEFYISDDTTLGDEDIHIYSNQCGEYVPFSTDKCEATGEITCSLSTVNELLCGSLTPASRPRQLGAYLAQSPKEAHIILRACNGATTSCRTQAVALQFIAVQSVINTFSLSGETPVEGKIPIDRTTGGQFSVTWDAVSSDPYNIFLYLSNDEILTSNDIAFYSQNCGADPLNYPCGMSVTLNCRLSGSDLLGCGEPGQSNPPIDIRAFFDVRPKDAFILLRVCNNGNYSCAQNAVSVVFQ